MRIKSMKTILLLVSMIASTGIVSSLAIGQPPRGRGPNGPGGRGGPGGPGGGSSNAATTVEAFVAKWLTMDENKDGVLSKDELKDKRLINLFQRSDKNADDTLDLEEMKTLFESTSSGDRRPGGPGGPRGRGGPGEERRPPQSR